MYCAIYCRLSREDGAKEKESGSIQNQKSLLTEYAARRGWDVYAVYRDEDYSGADSGRPGFNAMLEDAKDGRFHIILCKTQSRFTRDMEMVERYIHGLFPLWGIRFVAVLDNVDTDIRGNKKARQINGLINEWYLEDLSENIRAVLDQKRREGKYIGGHPVYGYKKDPANRGRLIVDNIETEIVKRIFAMYLKGMSARKIAAALNAAEIPSPQNRRASDSAVKGGWSHFAVLRILKNEMYLGTMVQGTKKKLSYKSKKMLDVPKEHWIRVENAHEAIIDKKSFEAVQDLTLKNRRKQ